MICTYYCLRPFAVGTCCGYAVCLCGALVWCLFVFFFKQKTAYEMRISDWSSDVCSSDLDNGVAILADESLSSLASAFELARHHCVDAFSLKLCNMGGVANTLKVSAIAEASGIASDRKSTRLNSSH